MKIRGLWVAVVGLFAVLPSVVAAQQVTPTKAVVEAAEPQTLRAKNNFTFRITVDPAPQRYNEGWIEAWFECEPSSSGDLFASDMGDQFCKVPARPVKPHDGLATYDMILPITEKMVPGKWKLTQIDITQDKPHIIPFSGVAAFNIAPLHPIKLIDIQHPRSVEAGQSFTIKITVGDYPKDAYEDCAVWLGIRLTPAPHKQATDEEIKPDQRSYEFSSRFYPDTPGGRVEGEVTYTGGVVGSGDRLFGCRYPRPDGDRKFEFDLLPSKGLVTPTSAEVTVTRPQGDLLKIAAAKIQVQLKELKAALASNSETVNGPVAAVARKNIDQALAALDDTQSSFHKLAVTPKQTVREQVFFDDIRTAYKDSLAKLGKNSRLSGPDPSLGPDHLIATSGHLRPHADLAALIKDVLSPFEQNELAYVTVANAEKLVFDLVVKSYPQDAEVCYFRKGHSCCLNPDNTNTTIPSLTYAIWYVQFQMKGFAMKEVKHDPFRESNHVIEVIFH
jgi:hypothetical protein